MITCPNCGEIAINEIKILNESLRKQNFSITPILPTCKHCGAEASISHTCNGGNIIILNGTCGSRKSTVAELLIDKGFLAIDGDCVMQVVRHKKNIKQVAFCDMFDEIASEIDILSIFSENIVLSHVILPEDLDKFIEIFEARKMNYKFFLLKPDYQTAVERCKTRTCHTSVTPEYWVKHFYDLLVFDERVEVVDNTNMTAEQTVEHILDKFAVLPDGIPSDNFVKITFIAGAV